MSEQPSVGEAFRYWLKLGFISFGGPAGQIAIMHNDLVERKKWIDDEHFLQALNYCMILPGPEAQQLTIYIGWLLHGTKGGIIAGTLFVLPSVFILLGLSWLYAALGNLPAVDAFFYGLKPAVAAIVAEAVIRIGRKSLKNWGFVLVAALSFIGIYFFQVPFPAIIFGAGIIGLVGGVIAPMKFVVATNGKFVVEGHASIDPLPSRAEFATWQHSLKVIAVCLPLWFMPMALLGLWRGWQDIFIEKTRNNAKLGAALSAITAAVVGVVLNLSILFTTHVLLPQGKDFDWYALGVSLVAFVGMIRFKWGMIPVIFGSALAGYAWKMFIQ